MSVNLSFFWFCFFYLSWNTAAINKAARGHRAQLSNTEKKEEKKQFGAEKGTS